MKVRQALLFPSDLYRQSKSNFLNNPIKELVQTGNFFKALVHYTNLWNNGCKPDNFIFPYVLKASLNLQDQTMGLLIHNHAIKTGFQSNLFVANSLILLYAQFGQLKLARYLFDQMPQRNVVSWTAVISACTQNNEFGYAVELFRDMLIAGFSPNSYTMAALIPAFCFVKGVVQVHCVVIKHGFESDVYTSTALIDVYSKYRSIFSARHVFNAMRNKNLVSWNAMMSACNQNDNAGEALEVFAKMLEFSNIFPDSYSVVTILSSCAKLTALQSGKEIHCYVYKAGLEQTVFVGNGLIDMYGKCGVLEVAERVFKKMEERDVSSWTAIITSYGLHGQGTKAISMFEKMRQGTTIAPNSVTMTAVLTACAHSCLLEDGLRYFEAMDTDFCIQPTMRHYACMVNLLGRAGLLKEALGFIHNIPLQADVQVWEALLGTATIQGNEEFIQIARMHLLRLESASSPEMHVQLANAYAKSGRWEDVAYIRRMVPSKNPGQSLIQVLQ